MYNGYFKNDFEESNRNVAAVIDYLNQKVHRGKMVQVEGIGETIAALLDTRSGIDALIDNGNGLSGVAIRIQEHSKRNWGTYTIRYRRSSGAETEYAKRKREFSQSRRNIYPNITIQLYKDGKHILGGAVCWTADLIETAIEYEPFEKRGPVYIQTNHVDQNQFIVVPFGLVKSSRDIPPYTIESDSVVPASHEVREAPVIWP